MESLERIAERHGIRLLLQFGSTVTGHVHPNSDTDLAVLLERLPTSFGEYGRLTSDLQEAFQEAFHGREVDVSVVNHADPLFLKKILESCRLLHGDPRDLQRLRIYGFKRYQDHRRFLDLERRYVRDAVRRRVS
jgi:predicted nucleotidyltransferase